MRKKPTTPSRTVKKTSKKKLASRSGSTYKSLILVAILAIVTFATFYPALDNEFINIDDDTFIINNPKVRAGLNEPSYAFERQLYTPNYKPLVYLSWMTEIELWDLDAFHFHFINLLFHIFNCMLMYFIALRITEFWETGKKYKFQIAFFVSLLFAVHPFKVESIAWAVERKDVLFSFFFL